MHHSAVRTQATLPKIGFCNSIFVTLRCICVLFFISADEIWQCPPLDPLSCSTNYLTLHTPVPGWLCVYRMSLSILTLMKTHLCWNISLFAQLKAASESVCSSNLFWICCQLLHCVAVCVCLQSESRRRRVITLILIISSHGLMAWLKACWGFKPEWVKILLICKSAQKIKLQLFSDSKRLHELC